MDSENPIDLKRFIPKKANKLYLLKILFYTILLITLGTILILQMDKKVVTKKETKEIKGVEIELK